MNDTVVVMCGNYYCMFMKKHAPHALHGRSFPHHQQELWRVAAAFQASKTEPVLG